MEASSPPHLDLSTPLYYQLVHTLTALLPPPLDDTPEALLARNHAAIAKVAALLPVNANEADLAAQCIAARAQADDMLRLLRQHAGDIGLVLRLNAQYGSMVRTSLSVLGRLMRVQAVRQKREFDGAATEDAWAQHVAERSMLAAVAPDAKPLDAALPKGAPVATPEAQVADTVSENETDSQDVAFETWLSEDPWKQAFIGSGETSPREVVLAALSRSRLANSLSTGGNCLRSVAKAPEVRTSVLPLKCPPISVNSYFAASPKLCRLSKPPGGLRIKDFAAGWRRPGPDATET